MSDVEIGFGENRSETAILLLASAEKLGLPAESVRTSSDGFVVSEELADDAGFGEKPEKPAAKKAAAKKDKE